MSRASSRAGRFLGPIGLDLGRRCVKLAQLRRDAGGDVAVEVAIRRVERDLVRDWPSHQAELTALIRSMVRSGRFQGREVVSVVPDSLLEYRSIRMAPATSAELAATVHDRFGQLLDMADDDFRTQYLEAGEVWEEDQPRHELVAMAAPRTGIDDYLKLLVRCRLSPVALDAAPAALARCVARAASSDSACVLVDIGFGAVTITIVQDGRVGLVRRLTCGLRTLDEEIAGRLAVPADAVESMREAIGDPGGDVPWPADTLAREAAAPVLAAAIESYGERLSLDLIKCLQYHVITFRAPRPSTGTLLGGGARLPALGEVITRKTGVRLGPLEAMTPSLAAAAGTVETPIGLWTLAAGLSCYTDAENRA